MSADRVIEVIGACRFRFASEDDLQRGIKAALTEAGLDVRREVRLNARDRIDLLVGRTGVEVKTGGAPRDVQRQLERYLRSPLIDDLILVTVKAGHARIAQGRRPSGKTLTVHVISGSGL